MYVNVIGRMQTIFDVIYMDPSLPKIHQTGAEFRPWIGNSIVTKFMDLHATGKFVNFFSSKNSDLAW